MVPNSRRSAIGWPIRRTRHTASPRRRILRWRQLLIALIVVAVPLGLLFLAGSNTHTADAAHPVPAKPSPPAETAFYRRAAERTARLMGKPAPKWKVCSSCTLAFHGPDTVPENPATGHTSGDWQP